MILNIWIACVIFNIFAFIILIFLEEIYKNGRKSTWDGIFREIERNIDDGSIAISLIIFGIILSPLGAVAFSVTITYSLIKKLLSGKRLFK